jgi:signal transduction histidine kinase
MRKISLPQALIALVGGALLLGLVPAGVALDRRLAAELKREARADLAMAPKILADRLAARSDALMMRAKELADAPGLGEAVAAGDRPRALELARAAISGPDERVALVDGAGRAWTEPAPGAGAVEATRRGETPVGFVNGEGRLDRVALAPIRRAGRWRGAAGVVAPVGPSAAGTLAGLTRSDVVLLGPDGTVVTATGDPELGRLMADSARAWRGDGSVHGLTAPSGARHWAAVAPLGDAGSAVFLRSVAEETAVLPGLRRSAVLAALVALAVALLLGGMLAVRVARPVRAMATASRRLAAGDFDAPVPGSGVREVDQVSRAFRTMRAALAEKIGELTRANRELEDRQVRLQALQSELIQRDRLAATGRLVTELAHEIRNPVASVRNCLEIIDRRLDPGSDLREFSEMAIDELLRMHRLAETMLDANRPLDPGADRCDPAEVARKVAELTRTAGDGGAPVVRVSGRAGCQVAMGPDGLKQILLNLVENAREAAEEADPGGPADVEIRIRPGGASPGGDAEDRVVVEVLDDGPGLDASVRSRIFDPFFTTKDQVHGVGLGLFVAEGLVRRHGGRIVASDRDEGGACFRIELPPAPPDDAEPGAGGGTEG